MSTTEPRDPLVTACGDPCPIEEQDQFPADHPTPCKDCGGGAVSQPPLFTQGEPRWREGQAPEPWSGVQGPSPMPALLGDQGVPADIQAGEGWCSHLQRDAGRVPVPWEPAARALVRPACFGSTCLLGLLIIFFLQSAVLLPTAFSAATAFFSGRALWSVNIRAPASRP